MEAKLTALFKQIHSGKMKSDSAKILNYIIESKMSTMPSIEFKFAMPRQTVSARVSDLEDLGVIKKQGTHETRSGVYSLYVYESDPVKVVKNAKERELIKFNNWLKRGGKFKHLIDSDVIYKFIG